MIGICWKQSAAPPSCSWIGAAAFVENQAGKTKKLIFAGDFNSTIDQIAVWPSHCNVYVAICKYGDATKLFTPSRNFRAYDDGIDHIFVDGGLVVGDAGSPKDFTGRISDHSVDYGTFVTELAV